MAQKFKTMVVRRVMCSIQRQVVIAHSLASPEVLRVIVVAHDRKATGQNQLHQLHRCVSPGHAVNSIQYVERQNPPCYSPGNVPNGEYSGF